MVLVTVETQLIALEDKISTHQKMLETLNKRFVDFESRRSDIRNEFEREMANTTRKLEEKQEKDLLDLENEQVIFRKTIDIERIGLEKAVAAIARVKKDEEEFGRFSGHIQSRMSDTF